MPPFPEEYQQLISEAERLATVLGGNDPGSMATEGYRAQFQKCMAKLQLKTALDSVTSTAKLTKATWGMFWVTVALVLGNFILAFATLAQAGWFTRH